MWRHKVTGEPYDFARPNIYHKHCEMRVIAKDHFELREMWEKWVAENYEEVPDVADFKVKDSGERQQFESGMQRDVTTDKVDFSLALDGPMFKRYAEHLTKGAKKYSARNWMLAAGDAELQRFRESAFRHFCQWYFGDADEDHAAAVFFNINGAEYVKEKMNVGQPPVQPQA